MAALIAGWVAGYAMALVATAALTFLATRDRAAGFVSRWISEEVPVALLAVPASMGSMVGWTFVGLVAGAVYEAGGLEDQPDGLGSPSWPFSLVMVALALFAVFPLVVLARRYWWLWALLSASFAALFGWLLPVLATR